MVEVCDKPSIKWHREHAEDMYRIDKPFEPGPNSLPREIEEKVIQRPAKWFAKTFGW
jgi:hypothetical protein